MDSPIEIRPRSRLAQVIVLGDESDLYTASLRAHQMRRDCAAHASAEAIQRKVDRVICGIDSREKLARYVHGLRSLAVGNGSIDGFIEEYIHGTSGSRRRSRAEDRIAGCVRACSIGGGDLIVVHGRR